MALICPRDEVALSGRDYGAIRFFFCEKCHGMWLERKHINKLLDGSRRFRLSEPREVPERAHPDTQGPAFCPVGRHGAMSRQTVRGVQVDACVPHQGFWLDRGELQLLIRRYGGASAAGRYLPPDDELAAAMTTDVHVALELFLRDITGCTGTFGDLVHEFLEFIRHFFRDVLAPPE